MNETLYYVNLLKHDIFSIIEKILEDNANTIASIVDLMYDTFMNGGKVLIFGNGGSAVDAQHFAAELVGRFRDTDRKPLSAIALTTDTSIITAIGNDFGYEHVFSRQIEALGKPKNVAIGITTSGNSINVIKAFEMAYSKGMRTACFTGGMGGDVINFSDNIINVNNSITPRIQECHILIIHIICQILDNMRYR